MALCENMITNKTIAFIFSIIHDHLEHDYEQFKSSIMLLLYQFFNAKTFVPNYA